MSRKIHTDPDRSAIPPLPAPTGYADGLEVCEGFARLNPHNCAVRERTADGVSVGPCTHYLAGGTTCPIHGKVKHNAPLQASGADDARKTK